MSKLLISELNLLNRIKKHNKPKKTIPMIDPTDSDDDPFGPLKSIMHQPSFSDKERNHIYFYTEVDKDTCLDLNRKINELNKELLKHSIEYETEPPNIYLHINSFGGSLFAAFSTIDTIMNSRIPIISIIEGAAASAATIISMVCHKRYITPNSFMLIHQLSTGASGKYEEMKDDFMNDTALMELLYKLYLEHTSMDIKTIKRVLKRDLWWNADKCLENGLVDEIHKGDFLNINLKNHFTQSLFDSNKVSEIQSKGKKNSIEEIKNALSTVSSSKRKRIDTILAEPDESDSDDDVDEPISTINKKKSKSKPTKSGKRTKK
jgi:ATP-dependent protease ClpP protease subunit